MNAELSVTSRKNAKAMLKPYRYTLSQKDYVALVVAIATKLDETFGEGMKAQEAREFLKEILTQRL